MKDKNGIEICCENCINYGTSLLKAPCLLCLIKKAGFKPTKEAYEARIAELQKELNIVQESERAEAQEADRLREEVKELKAHNEVLQRRVQEFSMELLEQNMRDNKDVLERLKNWEEYLDKDMSTQSTDADDVSKKIRETDMSNIWWR